MLLTFPDMVFGDSISRVHTAKYHAAKSRFVTQYLRGRSLEQIALSRNDDRNLKNQIGIVRWTLCSWHAKRNAKRVWLAHAREKGLENIQRGLTLDSSKIDMPGLACFIPIFAEGLAKDPPAHVRRTK